MCLLVAEEEDLLDHPAFVAEQGAVVDAAISHPHLAYTRKAFCKPICGSNQPYRVARVAVGILLANAGYVVGDAHVEAVLDNLHLFVPS